MKSLNNSWYNTDNYYIRERTKRITPKDKKVNWVQYDEVTDTTGPSFYMDETDTVNQKWNN